MLVLTACALCMPQRHVVDTAYFAAQAHLNPLAMLQTSADIETGADEQDAAQQGASGSADAAVSEPITGQGQECARVRIPEPPHGASKRARNEAATEENEENEGDDYNPGNEDSEGTDANARAAGTKKRKQAPKAARAAPAPTRTSGRVRHRPFANVFARCKT